MTRKNKKTVSIPLEIAKLYGTWIVIGQFYYCKDGEYMDMDFFESCDLAIWEFNPDCTAVFEDTDFGSYLQYRYHIENDLLHATITYEGMITKWPEEVFRVLIKDDRATFYRLVPAVTHAGDHPSETLYDKAMRMELMRYRGKDFDYDAVIEAELRKAKSKGIKEPSNRSWDYDIWT